MNDNTNRSTCLFAQVVRNGLNGQRKPSKTRNVWVHASVSLKWKTYFKSQCWSTSKISAMKACPVTHVRRFPLRWRHELRRHLTAVRLRWYPRKCSCFRWNSRKLNHYWFLRLKCIRITTYIYGAFRCNFWGFSNFAKGLSCVSLLVFPWRSPWIRICLTK